MNLKYYLRGLGIGIIVTALIMGVSIKSHSNTMSESEIRAEAEKLGMVDGRSVLKESDETTGKDKNTYSQSVSSNTEVAKNQMPNKTEQTADGNKQNNSELKIADNKSLQEETTSKDTSKEDALKKETAKEDVAMKEVSEDKTKDKALSEQEKTSKTESSVNIGGKEDKKENETQSASNADTTVEEDNKETESTATKTVTITVNSGDGSQTVARKLANAGIVVSAAEYDRYLCQNGYDKKLRVGSYEIPVTASNEEIAKILTTR